jgi:putative DNA primase/helicase
MDICGFAGGGFHFTGRSSVGKTTCLRVAASVCGDKNYIKSWRTTDNGLESVAAQYNDSLLILDEMSQVDPNKAGDIAYMLANGCGKTRANSQGGAQSTKTWRVLFLSSGETSLSTRMGLGGKKSQVGQDIRLLNVSASPSNHSFGIFEDLHGFENGADLANFLIEKSAKYYGAVILKFIENLAKNRDYIIEYASEKIREFKKIYLPQNASGQDIRVFERFAFVGAVGEYATEKGLTGWSNGAAIDGCMKCFNSWLEEKGGYGNIEEVKLLEQIKLFFEQYAESRLLNIPYYSSQKVTHMVGYRDEDFYYITPESFKTALCKGVELRFAISVLKNKGWLIVGNDGKNSIVKTINHVNTRVYKLSKQNIMS